MQVLQVNFPMSNVLDAVANGVADTGVIRACVLETIPELARSFYGDRASRKYRFSLFS
ncbi:hypothetical protein OURE66S_00518 [Oligella ureolytica]